MPHKIATIGMVCLSLTACDPGTTIPGIPPGNDDAIKLIKSDETSGVYTLGNGGSDISADLTFRASSAYLNNGSYVKVKGHEVKAAYGKTETASSFTKAAGNFTGILISTTKSKDFTQAEVEFTPAQVTELGNLRTDIATLKADLNSKPDDPLVGAWKASLNTKLNQLADLVSYSGLSVDVRELASGNGYYGLFASKDDGVYEQISGVYAFADGKTAADYTSLRAAGGESVYASKFKGGAIADGQLIDLTGNGNVTANFSTQQLSANFDVSNAANTETGAISFNGVMSANAGDNTGAIFETTNASYDATDGLLSDMSGGNAEVAALDGGNSVLGSVSFTDGNEALVGAFGGDK